VSGHLTKEQYLMRRFAFIGLALAIVGFVVFPITAPVPASAHTDQIPNTCPNDPTHVEPGRAVDPPTYRVRRGDTLIGIGRRCGLDWRRIADWNGIQPPYTIWGGQPLTLAPPAPPPPPPAPTPPPAEPPPPAEDEPVPAPGGDDQPEPGLTAEGPSSPIREWPWGRIALGGAVVLAAIAVVSRWARPAATRTGGASHPTPARRHSRRGRSRSRRRARRGPIPMSPRAVRWGLGCVIAAMVLVGLDYLAVIVAQDELSTMLHAGEGGLFWIVNTYTIAYAGGLGVAGLLVAHYGVRRVLVGGLVVFAVGALGAARAQALAAATPIVVGLLDHLDATLVLSLARGAQGLGAAALVTSAMALILGFPEEKRDGSITSFNAAQLLGFVLGPLTGAYLLERSGWPAIFVVLAAAALVVLAAVLGSHEPEKPQREGRVDWLAGILLMAFLALTSYGMLDVVHHGASVGGLATAVAGVVALAGFIAWELVGIKRLGATAGYDLSPLRNPRFRVACVLHSAFWGALLGTAFLHGHYLLVARKYPALSADQLLPLIAEHGLDGVPGGFDEMDAAVLVLGLGAALIGAVVAKVLKDRSRAVVTAGFALVAIAMVTWSRFDLVTSKWAIAGSFAICGLGVGAGVTSLTREAMAFAPREHPGLTPRERREVRRQIASILTIFRTFGQLGGALGVLMMATVVRPRYRIDEAAIASLTAEQQGRARAGMVDAAIVARDTLNLDLYEAARQAWMPAFGAAMLAGAGVAVLGAVFAWRSRSLRNVDSAPGAAS
jgi:MFS family permease/LysM repeat protein